MMEGRLLWSVGRGRDALAWFQRAHDLNPLHNGENWSLALNLAEEGHKAESRALVAQMQVQWPGQLSTRDARFWTSIVNGANDVSGATCRSRGTSAFHGPNIGRCLEYRTQGHDVERSIGEGDRRQTSQGGE